jgi:hypothetical protein
VNAPTDNALVPVIEALLSAAENQAAHEVSAAADLAAQAMSAARVQADGVLAEARVQGRADAAGAAGAELARGHREARGIVLAARKIAYDQLMALARAAVSRLLSEPDYPKWRESLVAIARRSLGPDAVIRDEPGGGISASLDGRRLDLRLGDMADRAVAQIAGEAESSP